MHALRNNRFRRWVAGGLAVTWLFTVMACAVDTDAAAADAPQVSQLASQVDSAALHHTDGGTKDDPCCQWQSSAVISFNVVKLPQASMLLAIVPVVLLLVLSLPFIAFRVPVRPDQDAVRRRFDFLVHSLQAQAPPR